MAKQNRPIEEGKDKKFTPPPRNLCSQTDRLSDATTLQDIPLESYQAPFAASQNLKDLSQLRGQKRKDVFTDKRPDKRVRKSSRSLSEPSQLLSIANLEEHNRFAGSRLADEMDPGIATPESGGRKRPPSRRSSTADLNQETASTRSQTSSYTTTAANYRFSILDNARIFIRPGPPLIEIQPRINAVFHHVVTEERKRQLSRVAKSLCDDFVDVLGGPNREDDCVEPIHHALSSMDNDRRFSFPRKADWDPSLKPSAQQNSWDWSSLEGTSDETDDPATRLRKRQQIDTFPSPETSEPAMPPPHAPPPLKQAIFLVKTPRPDITVGLRHSSVVEALEARGLRNVKASDFLKHLQRQQLLCSDPAQGAWPIRFPPIVVEGKSYATGKPVFEAQNQASVSGSCMTNLQHKLADLVEATSPGSFSNKAPLAFSICTEGPHMELWVHYTTLQDGIRMYNMSILRTCHASILEGVVEFVIAVDNVMSWAATGFLDDIADQLVLVEKAGRVQHAA